MAFEVESNFTKRVMCGRVRGGHRKVGKAPLRWSDLVARHGCDLLEKEGVETEGFDHAFGTSAIKSHNIKRKNGSSMHVILIIYYFYLLNMIMPLPSLFL